MNICDINKCECRDICKIYEFTTSNYKVNMSINSCEYKNFEDKSSFKPQTTNMDVFSRTNNIYPDFKKYENSPMKVTPVETPKGICQRCESEVDSLNLETCSQCGMEVCNNCYISTIGKDNKMEILCEKCWNGDVDPIDNRNDTSSLIDWSSVLDEMEQDEIEHDEIEQDEVEHEEGEK